MIIFLENVKKNLKKMKENYWKERTLWSDGFQCKYIHDLI
jgi:hypothetical protein